MFVTNLAIYPGLLSDPCTDFSQFLGLPAFPVQTLCFWDCPLFKIENRCCSALSVTPVRAATQKAPELAQLRSLLYGVQQGAICARNNTTCKWSLDKRTLRSAPTLRTF